MEAKRMGDGDTKITILGTIGVGKSALVCRLINNEFIRDYDPTIEDVWRKELQVDGVVYNLAILDSAGGEVFKDSMFQSWVVGADGFVVVYDITNEESFTKLDNIKEKIDLIKYATDEYEQGDHIPIVLAGNKSDLDEERSVSTDKGTKLGAKWKCPFLETTAKNNDNVLETFEGVVREVNKRRKSKNPDEKSDPDKKCIMM